jgi:hypothetical protein
MDPIGTAGTGGITAATPQRVFLSHTSRLGRPGGAGSFVAAAVLRTAPAGRADRVQPFSGAVVFSGSGEIAAAPPPTSA